MAILGRDLDVSERKVAFQWCSSVGGQSLNVLTADCIGVSAQIRMFMVPFPCTLQSGTVYNQGSSVGAQLTLVNERWNGSAMATYAIGISNMVLNNSGTSGPQGFSGFAAAGSTLLNLQMGDIVSLVTSVANTATRNLIVELVVKKTQDIVAYNNVST